MEIKSVAAMQAANAKRSADKLVAVRDAIQKLLNDPCVREINPSAIESVKGTPSRQFIYDNSGKRAKERRLPWDLLEEIAAAQRVKAARLAQSARDPRKADGSLLGLRAQNKTFQARLETLKAELAEARVEIAELQKQKRLALGAKLHNQILIDPTEHQRVIVDNNRLSDLVRQANMVNIELKSAENELTETVRTLRLVNEQLMAKLADNAGADNVITLTGRHPDETQLPVR